MNFDQTLDEHIRAIRNRDFDAFSATVSPDEVVLITAEGQFLTGAKTFHSGASSSSGSPEPSMFDMPGCGCAPRFGHLMKRS